MKGRTLLKVASVASTGAGPTLVALRPNLGEVWKVKYIFAWHEELAAAQAYWEITDGVVTLQLVGMAHILPQNTEFHFGQPYDGMTGPSRPIVDLKFTNTCYPSFIWIATAAGKNGYIQALVEQYRGLTEV